MITDIYYGFGLLALLATIIGIIRFNKFYYIKEWIVKFKKVNNKTPKLNEFRTESDYNLFISLSVSSMVLTTWIFLGLLTNNWFVYLSLIILGILLSNLPFKWTKIHKLILLKFSVLKFLVVLFMILNNFIFKLNILELFNNF